MARNLGPSNEIILQKALKESWGELSSKNPAVLSCGGIYIPHRSDAQRVYYHVLTTPNAKAPVKVVTSVNPRSILQMVLEKESMN